MEKVIKETKKKKEKKERNDKRKKSEPEFLPDENRRGKFLSFSSMYDMKKGFSPVSHSASIRKEELSALLLEAETQPVDHVGMHVILESLELQMRAAGFCSKIKKVCLELNYEPLPLLIKLDQLLAGFYTDVRTLKEYDLLHSAAIRKLYIENKFVPENSVVNHYYVDPKLGYVRPPITSGGMLSLLKVANICLLKINTKLSKIVKKLEKKAGAPYLIRKFSTSPPEVKEKNMATLVHQLEIFCSLVPLASNLAIKNNEEQLKIGVSGLWDDVSKMGLESFWYTYYPHLQKARQLFNLAISSFESGWNHGILNLPMALASGIFYSFSPKTLQRKLSTSEEDATNDEVLELRRNFLNLPDQGIFKFLDQWTFPAIVTNFRFIIPPDEKTPQSIQNLNIYCRLLYNKEFKFDWPSWMKKISENEEQEMYHREEEEEFEELIRTTNYFKLKEPTPKTLRPSTSNPKTLHERIFFKDRANTLIGSTVVMCPTCKTPLVLGHKCAIRSGSVLVGDYNCDICRTFYTSKQMLEDHFNTRQHKKREEYLDNTLANLEPICVLLHFHGGGFVAQSSASHQVYLRDWAIQTEWIVISVDYHTAPEFKFPVQIDEGWSVYELLIEGKLGFRPHRIILVGDSAGGTIASSVILRAIQEKARIPDGLVMFYPALNLTPSPTPSRLMNCLDTLIPFRFLIACLQAYVPNPENIETLRDMKISPLFAPKEIIKNFPPTCIMGAGFDPLLDDSVEFIEHLKQANVPCLLEIKYNLPHGFLNMQKVIPEMKEIQVQVVQWFKNLAEGLAPTAMPTPQVVSMN